MKKRIAILLALALLLGGCGSAGVEDLSKNFRPSQAAADTIGDIGPTVTDFGLRLLNGTMEPDKNSLISPLSVITALSMTANGADGETLRQMEEVLGGDMELLNPMLKALLDSLGNEAVMVNSIWIKDTPTLTVKDSFLQTNADWYGAGVFREPFDDATLGQINGWVEENTDGQIKDILDRIDPDAVMYLVNALNFEAKWEEPYEGYQVYDRRFTTESGEERTVSMMYSEEGLYLETEKATGFLKYYEGRRYAFVALLPAEGTTVAELAASLDGALLRETLTKPQEIKVYAAMPKFETAFDAELKDVLTGLGMTDAFDSRIANFSRMGSTTDGTNLCIGRVIHKTKITVAEEGTKAAASTLVEMRAEGAAEVQEETRTVTLNRPFLYMIVDTEHMTPVFMGTLSDPQV